MIWVVRSPDTESHLAAQWLVRRFIDPQAGFSSWDDLSVSKRRNGTSGASDLAVNSAFAELASFDHLLKQHGLASDPALLFLSHFLNSPYFQSLLDSAASIRPPPTLAGSDPGQDCKQQAFALLDTLYEWLREQVQNDLDIQEGTGHPAG